MTKHLFLFFALLCGVVQGARAQSQEYITDVMLIGCDNTTDVNALWYSYVNAGWRGVDYDLNLGADGHFIYLMYKTNKCVGSTGSPINDLYLRIYENGGSGPGYFSHQGHTYYKTGFDGDSDFKGNEGDLNTGASGYWISLYYTKDPNSAVRINNIYFNGSEEFAVGENGGHTPCDLNKGAGGNFIYMHFDKSIYLNKNGKEIETSGNWMDYRSNSYSQVVDNTIYINSEAELARLTYDTSKGNVVGYTVVLNKDLDMSAHTWIPLGIDERYAFRCDFNGNGHTVKGIYVGNLGHSYSGFVGYTLSTAQEVFTTIKVIGCNYIKNLTITDSYIEGGDCTGGVVGDDNPGTSIMNVVCDAEVIGNNKVGGIVGSMWGISIVAPNPEFRNNLFLGKVSGASNRGALMGYLDESLGSVQRSNNYYIDPASDVGNSNDVRAYPISLTAPEGTTLSFSNGHTFNGTTYCPAGNTSFKVKHTFSFDQAPYVMVNGKHVAAQGDVYSSTFEPTMTNNVDVTATASGIAGSGTKNDPYVIASTAQWDVFSNTVSNGVSFDHEYVKLGADISVRTMAGIRDGNAFSGTFDGDGHTMNVAFGSAGNYTSQSSAPFGSIENAVIKNLTICGNIYSNAQFNSSLVVSARGTDYIENCVSRVCIHSGVSGDCSNGGFVGIIHNDGSLVNFNCCAFLGELTGTWAQNWGGFVGWRAYVENNHNYVNFSKCLFSPNYIVTYSVNKNATFCRSNDNTSDGTGYVDTYYTATLEGTVQGTKAYTVACGTNGLTLDYGTPTTDYGYDGVKEYDSGLYCGGTLYTSASANVIFTPVSKKPILEVTAANAASLTSNGNDSYTLTMNGQNVSVTATMYCHSVTLYDNQSNLATIADNNNLLADVTLSGRTLYRDGDWNTLCLPFDVDIEDSPLKGAEARTLSEATFSDGTLTLNFGEPVAELTAGTPYIIKWDKTTYADLIIKTPADWDDFANAVNSGKSYSGKIVVLDADIEVSEMVGLSDSKFKGTFDGNDHKLTFTATTSNQYCAPFRYVEDATIMNLHTEGTITTSKKFAAGLVAHTKNTTTINNCWSSVNIISSVSGDGSHGGIVAYTVENASNTTLTDCLFDGSITGASTNSCGGLIGWNYDKATLTNCVFRPTSITLANSDNATFCRGSNVTVTNCYYSQNLPGVSGQGSAIGDMTNDDLRTALGSGWKVSGDNVVPVMDNGIYEITNPVFVDVTITAAEPLSITPTGDGKVSFVGNYDPETLTGGSMGKLYLGSNNQLYYPSADRTMNAFRAYFNVDLGGSNGVRSYRLNFGENDVVTGIIEIHNSECIMHNYAGAWYDLQGRKLNGKPTQKGMYINNGKKIVIE